MPIPKWFFSLALFIEAISPLRFFLLCSLYAIVLILWSNTLHAALFLTCLLAVYVVVFILKLVTGVPRRTDALIQLNHTDRAFPSGHAAAVAFLVPMMTYTAPWEMPLLTACVFSALGVVVGVSRLSLKVHTLTQVLVGALIGVVVPLLVLWFVAPLAVEYMTSFVI
jgi:membrane-associated phospholipid phosphatase